MDRPAESEKEVAKIETFPKKIHIRGLLHHPLLTPFADISARNSVKAVGQRLFLNILLSNFMARTRWKVGCDWASW